MILYRQKSNLKRELKVRFGSEPYLIVNLFFTGVILLIIAYSGFYSPVRNNYPVVCLHEKLTGEPCFSCGLSHSFSLIVRGRFADACRWNIYGMRVFLFFASQLALRVFFSIFYLRYTETRRQLIIVDAIGSTLIFLLAFWPFLARIISDVL